MSSPIRDSWEVVEPIIEAVSLPFNGKGIQEKSDGTMAVNEEGVWMFSFDEEYTYSLGNTGVDEKSLSSTARIILGIQVKRGFLNAIVADKPQKAMMDMTYALRSAIQTASAAHTFRDANPSFACRFLRSEQLFADALNLGVIQVTLELKGFDS